MSAGRNVYGVVAILFFLLLVNTFNRVGTKSLFFVKDFFSVSCFCGLTCSCSLISCTYLVNVEICYSCFSRGRRNVCLALLSQGGDTAFSVFISQRARCVDCPLFLTSHFVTHRENVLSPL
jgi:SNF family Na+-dependent transporter